MIHSMSHTMYHRGVPVVADDLMMMGRLGTGHTIRPALSDPRQHSPNIHRQAYCLARGQEAQARDKVAGQSQVMTSSPWLSGGILQKTYFGIKPGDCAPPSAVRCLRASHGVHSACMASLPFCNRPSDALASTFEQCLISPYTTAHTPQPAPIH